MFVPTTSTVRSTMNNYAAIGVTDSASAMKSVWS
jgi:hypothetical protein